MLPRPDILRALLALVLLTAAPAGESRDRYDLVLVLRGSLFAQLAWGGMQAAAEALPGRPEVALTGPEVWDTALEAAVLSDRLALRPRGVVLMAAGEGRLLAPSIATAAAGGVPVITFDSDAPASARLAFVGTSNRRAGQLAGETMAAWLREHPGGGSIGVSHLPGPAHLDERLRGFTETLAELAPDIAVHVIDDGGAPDQAAAASLIRAMLAAHPDMRGVFCIHGNSGPAAAQAVRESGRSGTCAVLAFDLQQPVVDGLQDGSIRATVVQDPWLMGFIGMVLAERAARLPPTAGDSAWPITTLRAFLATHGDLPQELAQRLRAVLDGSPANGPLLETPVKILDGAAARSLPRTLKR
jgi:ribose transport system substrate-binding protein